MTVMHETTPNFQPLAREAVAIEALGNYQDADLALRLEDFGTVMERPDANQISLYHDGDFWREVFWHQANGRLPEGTEVEFYAAVVSEWVARIPGLYWCEGADRLRAAAGRNIEYESAKWRTYMPRGKTFLVSGGIGTIRLPPSESGYRLLSLSANYNASTGVPLLISDDQWQKYGLCEGVVIDGRAKLRRMPVSWASEFPSIRGIPKLCLTLSEGARAPIGELDRDAPVEVHPFTVMEYEDDNTALLDFVFAAADSTDPDFRRRIEEFFGHYCSDHGRNGSYLIAADVSAPLWTSKFQSPAEMRGAKAAELALIDHRVREALAGEDRIETVLRDLVHRQTDDLRRLSEAILIPQALWYEQGTVAEQAQKLLDKAVRANKLPELIQAIQLGY